MGSKRSRLHYPQRSALQFVFMCRALLRMVQEQAWRAVYKTVVVG